MRHRHPGRRRRASDVHRQPVGLRRAEGNQPHAQAAAGKGALPDQAGGRRLRRQGGHERAASRGADGLGHGPAREGEVLPAGEPQHPHQAPRHGDGRDHRLRQGRQTPGHEGAAHLRLRGLRLPGRAGFAARLHACRRSLQLPERGHHRHLRLYQQRARRRVPRLRRHAELLRGRGQPGPAGREGGHLPVGDPLPQRHPPRTGAAQRADRLAGYGLCRMSGGREGSV